MWCNRSGIYYKDIRKSDSSITLNSFACQKKCKHGIHLRTITFSYTEECNFSWIFSINHMLLLYLKLFAYQKNVKQESHLLYCTLWIWYIHSIISTKAWFPPQRWAPSPTFNAGDKFGGNYWRLFAQSSSPTMIRAMNTKKFGYSPPKFIAQPHELSFMSKNM